MHYARTLGFWLDNLQQRWDEAVQEVGLRKARVWRLYLAASKWGFARNRIHCTRSLATRTGRDGDDGMPLRLQLDRSAVTPVSGVPGQAQRDGSSKLEGRSLLFPADRVAHGLRFGELQHRPHALAGDPAQLLVGVDGERVADDLEHRQVGVGVAVGIRLGQVVALVLGKGPHGIGLARAIGVKSTSPVYLPSSITIWVPMALSTPRRVPMGSTISVPDDEMMMTSRPAAWCSEMSLTASWYTIGSTIRRGSRPRWPSPARPPSPHSVSTGRRACVPSGRDRRRRSGRPVARRRS